MKRHQILLVGCGAGLILLALGAGWFLVMAMRERAAADEARAQAYDDLQRIYKAPVFPSEENIARLGENQKELTAWVAETTELLKQGALQVEAMSPARFKEKLQATVRALSNHPGGLKGRMAPANFKFGFDRYLGESEILPEQDHVERLARQLAIIELICRELFAANILSLERIEREVFEEARSEEAPEPTARRRPRRDREPEQAAPAIAATPGAEFFSRQRVTVEFQARPSSFTDVLNRLAAMKMFVVVSEVEFRKTDDPLAKRDARSHGAAGDEVGAGAAEVRDLAKIPHIERMVTNPELAPPIRVTLAIDVYSFEGV